MQPFTTLTSTPAPLKVINVDNDLDAIERAAG